MADARFHHRALVEEFVRSLSFRASVKSLVTAMLALNRLELPTDALRGPFLQHLSGQTHALSFGDLRRVLMALARCWKRDEGAQGLVQSEQLEEICTAINDKAGECDPRDLIAVPQHLGRLQFVHHDLLQSSVNAIARLVSSRLSVLPLDVLRAVDGLFMLAPLVSEGQKLTELASKCSLLGQSQLQIASGVQLWSIGAQLLGSEIYSSKVWTLWINEVVRRRVKHRPEESRGQRIAALRRQMMKHWTLDSLPNELELLLEQFKEGSRHPVVMEPLG